MKVGYYLGGLALGLIIGGGIGYLIASDPKKKTRIDDFLGDVGDKSNNFSEKIKAELEHCYDSLTDEKISEIKSTLVSKADDQLKAIMEEVKT